MAELKVEIDPEEAGFGAERLQRIDRHFARYVDDGRLPGWLLAISRGGKLVHLATCGQRDLEVGLPVEIDTIWRVYSMTKPVTSVAAMMLYEEGAFELKDPVSKFIPSFGDVKVYRSGSQVNPVLEPASEPVRIWHLLTHTSGLTYGFHYATPVDAMYRAAGFEWGWPPGEDLAQICDRWAALPLLFQPGSEWNYSVSTDVLGRVVEVASGQSLDEFFAERIFGPLGMTDTGFFVSEADADRLAALYVPAPGTRKATRNDAMGRASTQKPACLSGGGGLHRVLGRPAGGDPRPLHDPAPPFVDPSDPSPAQAARLPGSGRLTAPRPPAPFFSDLRSLCGPRSEKNRKGPRT